MSSRAGTEELLREAAPRALGALVRRSAIAAEHDRAARAEDTDWRQILGLHVVLERLTGNPMVVLNRAIATAMVEGPRADLELLEDLDEPPSGHHRLHAARAHLLEWAGEADAAAAEYRKAATRTANAAEEQYLTMRAARLNERRPS